MDWDDDWWHIVVAAILIVLCVGLIVAAFKRCRVAKRQQNEVLVQPVTTVQGAYVTSPQYNPTYQHQNAYLNNDTFGWNVTDITQLQHGGVNIRTNTDRILVLPREPIGYQAPPLDIYDKPPPYNPNP